MKGLKIMVCLFSTAILTVFFFYSMTKMQAQLVQLVSSVSICKYE